MAAAVVFSYAWVVPAIVSVVMRFSSLGLGTVGLWDVVCLYGYSMCVFVPASLVLIVQGRLFVSLEFVMENFLKIFVEL